MLNININLTNYIIVVLSFNETSNKITVIYNPHQQTIQLILIRRNIPNKSISTLEVTYKENYVNKYLFRFII